MQLLERGGRRWIGTQGVPTVQRPPPSQLDLFTAYTVDIDGTGMFNSRFYTESSDTSILGCVELHH